MYKKFTYVIFFWTFLLTQFNCTGNNKINQVALPAEKATVIIPFMPGDCHQCNDVFYKNLEVLDSQHGGILFLIPDNYSDDLDYIKKANKLESYKNDQFIFSSALFNKYRIYEQSFVLQFGSDSNYLIFNNANELIAKQKDLSKAEIINLGDYKVKKSSGYIIAKNKEQICITSRLNASAFDYINFRNSKNVSKVAFSEEQLLKNFTLNFRDATAAKSKLDELNVAKDLTNNHLFEHFEFVDDSLFVSSSHTYIESMKDSTLGGFNVINIYKDGKYLDSRSISYEGLPSGYFIMPKFHVYKGALFVKVVKTELEVNRPNYFMAKFELEHKEYKFKKMLSFTLPDINKNVGYVFTDLSFSGKYFVNPISNLLYDLESEKSVMLNIPVNERFVYSDLVSGFKGVKIVILHINIQYPNLIILYKSTDKSGKVTLTLLNYNLDQEHIEGEIKVPEEQYMFLNSDLSKFGYYLWLQPNDNHNLVYKKLF